MPIAEIEFDRRACDALLRQDLASFIHRVFLTVSAGEPYLDNWHIQAIAYHLERCARGEITRLIITLPPRHLKSIAVSVAFPAWLLGRDPTCRIIAASYAQDLAEQFHRDTRQVMGSRWYRSCFPATAIRAGQDTQSEFATSAGGFRKATSVDGTLTGRGGRFLIVDDPHKAGEVLSDTKRRHVIDWFQQALYSRLDRKDRDVIILIQQRLHENDLAGHLLESGGWTHLNIPAIAEEEQQIPIGPGKVKVREVGDVLHPERESMATLEAIQRAIGSYAFAGQYLQRPAPLEGGLVQWPWFRHFAQAPARSPDDMIVESWDSAVKAGISNDFSVCTTWQRRGNEHYLLHLSRDKLEFPDLKRRILAQAEAWQADLVLIEDAGAGSALIQDLKRESSLSIVGCQPKDDKATRLMAVSPIIEAGRVFLPEDASWLADFQHELINFPAGKHDDQVDSLSQYLGWAQARPVIDDLPIAGERASITDEFGDSIGWDDDY